MTPLDLSPGQMITPNVRLVRLLGEGGMGSVWVADHLTLHTQVAVKFMSVALARDAAAVARFSREAAAAARIKSPHVVQIFDHGVVEGTLPYIVMELLEGEDLGQRIQRVGTLDPFEVARILTQACKALAKAHVAGIVHRDLKPDNIFLLDQDGEIFVKVLDFGIAKQTDSQTFGMTATGSMVGTPYYMSPEQVLSAKHVDFHADLWSLAVVTYHCLVGDVPFQGETLGALCVAIDKGTFRSPRMTRGDLPPTVEEWFTKALRREPTERFNSAREMADTFQFAVGGGKSISNPPPSLSSSQHRQPLGSLPDSSHSVSSGSRMPPSVEGLEATAASEGSISNGSHPKKANPTFSGASVSQNGSPLTARRTWILGALAGALVATSAIALITFLILRKPSSSTTAETSTSSQSHEASTASPSVPFAADTSAVASPPAASHVVTEPTLVLPTPSQPHGTSRVRSGGRGGSKLPPGGSGAVPSALPAASQTAAAPPPGSAPPPVPPLAPPPAVVPSSKEPDRGF